MSVPGSRVASRISPQSGRENRRLLRFVLVGLFAAVILVGLTGGPVGDTFAATNDTADDEAPRLVSGSPSNETTVRLLVTDNVDVNESSIGVEDFVHEAGSPTAVNVTESGSNATVLLSLGQRVDEENLTVAVAQGSEIRDEAGNVLTASSDDSVVVVSGMDSVPPALSNYDVERQQEEGVELSLTVSEPLGGINVSVYGAVDDQLGLGAFTFDDASNEYRTTYNPANDGNVTFELEDITDESENTRTVALRKELFVDMTPPDARAGIDVGASTNRTLTFDADSSTDTSAIDSYGWDFGDGTSATGDRVTHTFEPGNYTVELAVTDEYGNTGTDTLEINLTSGTNGTTDPANTTDNPRISIQNGESSSLTSAFVQFEGATAGEAFNITAANRALVGGSGFALDRLEVTLAANGSGTLGLSSAVNASVEDAASATDTEPVGGFSAIHNLPADGVENATFGFSVDIDEIEATGANPDNVTLMRESSGEWTTLPTTNVDVGNGTARYTADSPGFSEFAIVTDPAPSAGGSDGPGQVNESTPTATPTSGGENATETATPSGVDEGRQFAVTNVTLSNGTVAPGETVRINATVENRGNTSGGYTAGLSINDSLVGTDFVGLNPGNSTVAEFTYQTNETGTYRVIVNGTSADRELTVGESDGDGGLLGSILGVFGFLPIGLLRTVGMFVVLPLAVVFGALKVLAFYLGY